MRPFSIALPLFGTVRVAILIYNCPQEPECLTGVKMNGFTCIAFLICFVCSAAVEVEEASTTTTTPAPEDVARRELTDAGYVIRYNDELYRYPMRVLPVAIRRQPPEETNMIETSEEEEKRRPLFYFTTYEAVDSGEERKVPGSGPYIEIRKKRELNSTEEVPESSNVGKLRRKRTYCGRCGWGGGHRKVYVPVTYVVYPVYYGGGGGGKGCYSCGGGYGGGGGGSGSFSYSSSSSHSASGSFGWGK